MDITKFESLTVLPSSGVQKRTLKGLCGRLKQVEGRVEAAYEGLNKAVQSTIAKAVSTLSLAFHAEVEKRDAKISVLQSEIDHLKNVVTAGLAPGAGSFSVKGDIEPIPEDGNVETPL